MDIAGVLTVLFSGLDVLPHGHPVLYIVSQEIQPLIEASLIEKLGFRLEGHQKSDTLIRGEWRDTLVYAVLESER